MAPEEHRAFWRNVQFTVDKDVARTDRSSHFFRGEGNPHVESMRYCAPQATDRSCCSCGRPFFQVPTVTPEQRTLGYFSQRHSASMVLVSWGSQQVPPKGASKATILWASTQALLGSREWWLSLPECLPMGGPLDVKATLSPGLASWTFCCCLANNRTKLAADKNVPAKPPFVTGRPTFFLPLP